MREPAPRLRRDFRPCGTAAQAIISTAVNIVDSDANRSGRSLASGGQELMAPLGAVRDRQVQQIFERLVAEYPYQAPDVIATLLHRALGRTSGAKVQAFRGVLAERQVRASLGGPLGRSSDAVSTESTEM